MTLAWFEFGHRRRNAAGRSRGGTHARIPFGVPYTRILHHLPAATIDNADGRTSVPADARIVSGSCVPGFGSTDHCVVGGHQFVGS
jgi:hypothetical protein